MADLALVNRFRSGEEQAFFELVTKYKDIVSGIVFKFIKDRHETEDVSQEVFLQVFKALPNFKGKSRFFTWLYSVVFNVCLYYKRGSASKKNAVSYDSVETFISIPDLGGDPGDLAERKNVMEIINAAIEKLPEELKSVFELRELEGFSYEEISKIAGVSIGTVKSRIFNSRAYIARELAELKAKGGL